MLVVETVPDSGLDMKVSASEDERAALAGQCGLAAIQSFEADFQVRKQAPGRFKVSGQLRARVTQTCVVSLEPFETQIHADIGVDFAPSDAPSPTSLLQDDPPDPIINGQIDLGALAAEFLLLNLDLYPRKPGAVFAEAEAGGERSEKISPFAVLLRR
jgi:uncharacterized metal-binding protein YceD (DUF177 family)